jgi:hypothetical protein
MIPMTTDEERRIDQAIRQVLRNSSHEERQRALYELLEEAKPRQADILRQAATEPAKREVKLWRYHLPSENGEGWAIIVIGSDGFFSAVSDYGSYGYFWSHHGCKDVRQFFLRAPRNWDYFLGKLAPKPWGFDGPATYKAIRECILEGRRRGGWDRMRARTEWDALKESGLENGHLYEYYQWGECTRIDCFYELGVYSPPGDAVAFCKETLGRLALVIRDELHAEGLEVGS